MELKLQYHNGTAKYQLILGYSRKYPHTLIDGIEFGTKKLQDFKGIKWQFLLHLNALLIQNLEEFKNFVGLRFSEIPDQNLQNSGEIFGLPVSLTESSLHDFQCCPWGGCEYFPEYM